MNNKPDILRVHLWSLTPADFERHPVWRFILEEEDKDDRMMTPVEELPVDHLRNRIVGVQVQLANGEKRWARLSNIDLKEPRRAEHFLSISLEKDGKWFHLGRYFDPWYHRTGPDQLATFLGLPADHIFPITYDLRPYAVGNVPPVAGVIPKEPRERLAKEELHALPKTSNHPELLKMVETFGGPKGSDSIEVWRAYLEKMQKSKIEYAPQLAKIAEDQIALLEGKKCSSDQAI